MPINKPTLNFNKTKTTITSSLILGSSFLIPPVFAEKLGRLYPCTLADIGNFLIQVGNNAAAWINIQSPNLGSLVCISGVIEDVKQNLLPEIPSLCTGVTAISSIPSGLKQVEMGSIGSGCYASLTPNCYPFNWNLYSTAQVITNSTQEAAMCIINQIAHRDYSDAGLSPSAIAGIAIGCVVFSAAAITYFVRKNNNTSSNLEACCCGMMIAECCCPGGGGYTSF